MATKQDKRTVRADEPVKGRARTYLVVRPWYGVAKGDTFTTDKLHPAIRSNVMLLKDDAAAKLEPATPAASNSGSGEGSGQGN